MKTMKKKFFVGLSVSVFLFSTASTWAADGVTPSTEGGRSAEDLKLDFGPDNLDVKSYNGHLSASFLTDQQYGTAEGPFSSSKGVSLTGSLGKRWVLGEVSHNYTFGLELRPELKARVDLTSTRQLSEPSSENFQVRRIDLEGKLLTPLAHRWQERAHRIGTDELITPVSGAIEVATAGAKVERDLALGTKVTAADLRILRFGLDTAFTLNGLPMNFCVNGEVGGRAGEIDTIDSRGRSSSEWVLAGGACLGAQLGPVGRLNYRYDIEASLGAGSRKMVTEDGSLQREVRYGTQRINQAHTVDLTQIAGTPLNVSYKYQRQDAAVLGDGALGNRTVEAHTVGAGVKF